MNYDQLIYDIAIKNGFNPTAAKLIVAQARLESADYSSNVFKQNNNMFGMKYVKQPLAVRGSRVPSSETISGDADYNYYAKYKTPDDSVKDLVERLYTKTIHSVTPSQLKDSTSADDFAQKLKARSYFGGEASKYAAGLKAKLLKVNVAQIIQVAEENKVSILMGLLVVVVIAALYKLQS